MGIQSIVKRSTRMRNGKGFSKAELKDTGLSFNEALKQGIQIDPRRSTKHKENVKTLKTYAKKMKPKPKAPAKEEKVKTAKPKEVKTS